MNKKKNKAFNKKTAKIGFIGTGWIGKNYADNFEERGFKVIRYSLDKKYIKNKEAIAECDVVFVAVNTPYSFKNGFDGSIVEKVVDEATANDQLIVIKSTVKVGFTEKLQKRFPGRVILHCPEFLTESTARHDVDHPERNIIGETARSHGLGKKLLPLLPKAKHTFITDSGVSEMVKYMGNCYFFAKNTMTNIFYQMILESGIKYEDCYKLVSADSRIGPTHSNAIHKGGRGAGGDCLPKDMATLREMLFEMTMSSKDKRNRKLLKKMYSYISSLEELNLHLLLSTKKDRDIVLKIFGDNVVEEIEGDVL